MEARDEGEADSEKKEHPEIRRPRVIAFDLDDTLWHPELWLCSGAPFSKTGSGSVHARGGEEMRFLADAEAVLEQLTTDPSWRKTIVVYVSRTEHTDWAEMLLRLMLIGRTGKSMEDLSDPKLNQIYPARKTNHFTKIQDLTGIAFEDMLFFDNEHRNIKDVAAMGVCCTYTPRGLTAAAWEEGLAQFAKTGTDG